MNDEELSFEEVATQIFAAEDVPIHLLYRFSDLSPQEQAFFWELWAQEDGVRRRIIARHLADISEENFVVDFSPLFGEMLMDADVDVRLAALDGLWDSTNRSILETIIQLMFHDVDTQVRTLAAATLGHVVLQTEWGQLNPTVGQQVVEALFTLNADPLAPETVRRVAVESLGASADSRVPDMIHAAYYGGDTELRLGAVFAMGRNADARWLPIVLDEMDSPYYEMRIEAARAAGGLGNSDCVEQLIELTHDDELEVRLAALVALGQIGSDPACEVLREIAADPDARDEEREAAETSLEEAIWLSGAIDFSILSLDEDDDDMAQY